MINGAVRVTGTDKLAIATEMYRRENALAWELARHVAALLTEINHHPTDAATVYNAAMIRVAKRADGDATTGEKITDALKETGFTQFAPRGFRVEQGKGADGEH